MSWLDEYAHAFSLFIAKSKDNERTSGHAIQHGTLPTCWKWNLKGAHGYFWRLGTVGTALRAELEIMHEHCHAPIIYTYTDINPCSHVFLSCATLLNDIDCIFVPSRIGWCIVDINLGTAKSILCRVTETSKLSLNCKLCNFDSISNHDNFLYTKDVLQAS